MCSLISIIDVMQYVFFIKFHFFAFQLHIFDLCHVCVAYILFFSYKHRSEFRIVVSAKENHD